MSLILIYILIGFSIQIAMINKQLNKRNFYELQIIDLILAVSIISIWPIIMILAIFKVEFSKVLITFTK
jgi:hypothetical protein